MFKKYTYIPYTVEQVTSYIAELETLSRLQDKALQNYRLLKDERYNQAYEGYTRNIDSAQKCLDFMLKSNIVEKK